MIPKLLPASDYENPDSGSIKITVIENPPSMSHLNFNKCFKAFGQEMGLLTSKTAKLQT